MTNFFVFDCTDYNGKDDNSVVPTCGLFYYYDISL